MNLSINQFEDILQFLPPIDVELVFEDGEGFYEDEQHEIRLEAFSIFIDFTVHESIMFKKGDHFTDPEVVSFGKTSFVSYLEILDNETDDVVEVTVEQVRTLSKKLESILETA